MGGGRVITHGVGQAFAQELCTLVAGAGARVQVDADGLECRVDLVGQRGKKVLVDEHHARLHRVNLLRRQGPQNVRNLNRKLKVTSNNVNKNNIIKKPIASLIFVTSSILCSGTRMLKLSQSSRSWNGWETWSGLFVPWVGVLYFFFIICFFCFFCWTLPTSS